ARRTSPLPPSHFTRCASSSPASLSTEISSTALRAIFSNSETSIALHHSLRRPNPSRILVRPRTLSQGAVEAPFRQWPNFDVQLTPKTDGRPNGGRGAAESGRPSPPSGALSRRPG